MRPSCRPRLEALEDRWLPSTLTVTNFQDGGKGSLRYEIAAAHSGDTIVFAKKLDRGGGTIEVTSNELYIDKNLTIQGPGAGLLTVSGVPEVAAPRIFEVGPGATVALSGLTIEYGGGHASAGGLPSDQFDGDGGGVLNRGTLTISGCTLSNNSVLSSPDSATSGGAIYNAGVLTVNGCTLSNNAALAGGGISNFGTATVSGCTLSGNSADLGSGSGIFNYGTLMVSGGTISFNSANAGIIGYGGGIYNTGTLTVSGCTLSGNSATTGGYGGGIYNTASGTATVSRCTLSGNSAGDFPISGNGGGIYNGGTAAALTVLDSVFSSNFPDNISGPYTDGGGNTFG
jgi:hypothetical protein